MLRVKVQTLKSGLHPSEVIVGVMTADGSREELVVDRSQSATTQFASGILWRVTIKIACLLSCLARHSEASNAFGFQRLACSR